MTDYQWHTDEGGGGMVGVGGAVTGLTTGTHSGVGP